MDAYNNLIVRLPQSLIRALGISNLPELNIIQSSLSRNSSHVFKSAPDEMAVYKLNKEIISALNFKSNYRLVNIFDDKLILPDYLIIDFNLISSLSLPCFKNLKKSIILPYASEVYSPVRSDVLNLEGFARCIKSSLRVKKFVHPEYFLNWTDMICRYNNPNFLPWFWKPLQMELPLYTKRIRSIANRLSKKYEFISNFLDAEKAILFQFGSLGGEKSVEKILLKLYSTSNIFRNYIDTGNANIFVKPHRSLGSRKNKYPLHFRGATIHTTNDLVERYIPSEIFINGSEKNFLLISDHSSSLYNFQISHFQELSLAYTPQLNDLLLTNKRIKLLAGFNPISLFSRYAIK